MIRTLVLALVALLCFAQPETGSAQPIDSTLNSTYGTLIEITGSTIVFVDLLSPSSEQRSVIRNQRSVAFGCTFEDVRTGVRLYMELEDSPSGKVALMVKFEGCAPIVSFDGTIKSINGDTLRVKVTTPVPDVSADVVVLGNETSISDCSGRPVKRTAIGVGDEVKIGGYSKGGIIEATYVVIASKCPEYKTANGILVSKRNDGIVVTLATGEIVDLVFGPSFPIFDDSMMNFVYTCDGRSLGWKDVEVGATLRLSYFDYTDAPDVLEAAVLEDGCPKRFSGVVVRISETSLFVTESDGVTNEFVFDIATQILSCSNRVRTTADLQPGVGVQGAWIEDGASRKLVHVQISDGCSYAFADMGVVIDVTEKSLTIRTVQDSVIDLTIDANSILIDCFGFVARPTRILQGDSVSVFYSQERGVNFLDLVQSFQSCEREKLSGVIVAASETAIVINTGTGVLSLVVNSDTDLYDCTGSLIASSDAIVGSAITARTEERGDSSVVLVALIDYNCAVTGIVSGPIVSFDDSLLVVAEGGVERSLYLADVTIVLESNGTLADRNALLVGRSVCLIVQSIDASSMVLQVILDSDCSSGVVARGVRVQGAIESVENGKMVVSARGQSMVFATMDITTIQHQRDGMATMSDLASGKTVLVMSERRLSDGTPVAESIVILDGTSSVDDESVSGNSILLSPNPASDVLRIIGYEDQNVDMITIRDMQGRLMQSVLGTRSASLRELPMGTYVVTVRFADARFETLPLSVIR